VHKTFKALIEQNHHYLEVYDWLAQVLEDEGDTEAAQRLLTQATQLSPKLVKRQRNLARIALANGDDTAAERALQAAVRWGQNSCFASAEEYRQLAAIYHDKGQSSKMLRLLADGRNRFSSQPSDRIQLLCSQAFYKRQLDENNNIDGNLEEIERLVKTHGKALHEDHLLNTARECYLMSRPDVAEQILRIVLCNHHDETEWIDRVRVLTQEYDRHEETEALIGDVQRELEEIHFRSYELLNQGWVEKAVVILNDAIELYPGNRTLNLLAVEPMIDYMRNHGVNQSYHFRCRHSLAHLLRRNRQDQEADHYLGQLTELPA
jgi:tetratricopeptide (TPR) repeat protein